MSCEHDGLAAARQSPPDFRIRRRVKFSQSTLEANRHPANSPDKSHVTMVSPSSNTVHTAYDSKIEGNVIITRVDAAINWMRKNSLWPMVVAEKVLVCVSLHLVPCFIPRWSLQKN
jgi:hypothetical protein